MENINYKLDQFEGPLDLLLTLISKNKIDINDIPIAMLCSQYMEYINAEENKNIEIASEFLLMASELMLIKSRMLLPKMEDEEDPRASLAEAVLEYQRAKMAAAKMNLLYMTYGLRFVKDQDEISIDKTYVADHSPMLLKEAYERAMKEVVISDEKAREKFEPIVSRRQVSVLSVASSLISSLKRAGYTYLDTYFVSESKSELIAKFMAVLEILRSGFVSIQISESDCDEGVVNAYSHIEIKLCDNIDEEKLAELFKENTETDSGNEMIESKTV